MSDEAISIRGLSLEDVLPLVRIAGQAFLEHARFPEMGLSATRYLREHPGWQWGAFGGGRLAGFLLTEPSTEKGRVAIRLIATDPGVQGKGIGGRLLDTLEARAREAGFPLLSVGTPFAGRFYEKYGFEITKVHLKVIKEIIRRAVKGEKGVAVRPLDFESAAEVLGRFEDDELRGRFLDAFLGNYRKDRGLALRVERDGELLGVVIGRVSEFYGDFGEARFFHAFGGGPGPLAAAFELAVSTLGLRWAGFCPPEDQEAAFEALGYARAERDFFWTMYTLEKRLDG